MHHQPRALMIFQMLPISVVSPMYCAAVPKTCPGSL
jgi:hypothetical protein